MSAYPRFSLPTVHPGHVDFPAGGGSDHPSVQVHPGHGHTRVAVGGRVIERELTDRDRSADTTTRALSH